MDFMTLVGFVGGISMVYYVMYTGELTSLIFNETAALLVFGGTFCCILISYPWRLIKKIPKSVLMVLFPPKTYAPERVIEILLRFAEKAKRDGISSLQSEIQTINDNFLKDGIQMLIDRVNPDIVRENLNKEISFARERHEEVANIFRTLGTYAPVFGLLGTLIGVIQVLKNLSDPKNLGASMAVAVTTTLYGIFSTNFIFLPICTKLQVLSERELFVKEVMIEGILSIQQGDIPHIINQKLKAYLAYKIRQNTDIVGTSSTGNNI
jgi:chemotaxis protein MotA